MLLIGIAFLLFAALLQFSTLSLVACAVLVGILFVVLAVTAGERFHLHA